MVERFASLSPRLPPLGLAGRPAGGILAEPRSPDATSFEAAPGEGGYWAGASAGGSGSGTLFFTGGIERR